MHYPTDPPKERPGEAHERASFLRDFNKRHYYHDYNAKPKWAPGGPKYTYLGQRRWLTHDPTPIHER